MAVDIEMIAEIEAEKKRVAEAKAASGGSGGAGFFILKDGEKATVRPLLNAFTPIFRHDFWNQTTQKMEVSAICAQSQDLPKECCAHCQKAEQTKNRKLFAVKQFILPFFLYGIRDMHDLISDGNGGKVGKPRTYEKDGQATLVRGIRYAQFKVGDPIFEFFLTIYKMGGDMTDRDFTIEQTGSKLEKKLSTDPVTLDPRPFTIKDVPAQTRDDILAWIAEKNPPSLIDGPDHDAFGANPPAVQSNGAKPVQTTQAPDF